MTVLAAGQYSASVSPRSSSASAADSAGAPAAATTWLPRHTRSAPDEPAVQNSPLGRKPSASTSSPHMSVSRRRQRPCGDKSQSASVWSRAPETSVVPSGDTPSARTTPACAASTATGFAAAAPPFRSHTRTLPSTQPVMRRTVRRAPVPATCHASALTTPPCPRNTCVQNAPARSHTLTTPSAAPVARSDEVGSARMTATGASCARATEWRSV